MKHYVSFLMNSGSDWTDRMKRLTARAPELNIFTSAYVLRDSSGWQITDAGRQFLTALERPPSTTEQGQEQAEESSAPPPSGHRVLRLVVDNTAVPPPDRKDNEPRRASSLSA